MEIKTTQVKDVIQQADYVKVLPYDNGVLVRRNNLKSIPSDDNLLSSIQSSYLENKKVNADVMERVADKLVYYYYHFILNKDQSLKTNFYNGFVNLMIELKKYGFKLNDFNSLKELAIDKKKKTDQLIELLGEKKSLGQKLLIHREISRLYDQFRREHTVYGEQSEPIFNYIMRHYDINFY